MDKVIDTIIIGGGPAGITAGIYTIRAGHTCLVFDNNMSALSKVKVIENYYGFQSISGQQLLDNGVSQYKALGGKIVKAQVVDVVNNYDNTFSVFTNKDSYVCKSIIICTGSARKKSDKMFDKYEGKNLSYCAVCDGYFYRGKTVAVIGEGDYALSEAKHLSKLAKSVVIITNQKASKIAPIDNIAVENSEVTEVLGESKIEAIKLANKKQIEVDGVFVAIGTLNTQTLALKLGLLINNNFIKVNSKYSTNVNGVFAAGDCIGGLLQISVASADGAKASLEAVKYVNKLTLGN